MRNKKFKELLNKLKKETLSRKNPHEIALGIGTGVFLGMFPVQGFKTAIVVLFGSFYKKVNIIAVFTASTILSFPVVVPLVYFFNYWVGAKILNAPIICTVSSFRDVDFKMLGSAVGALFLGGTVVGTMLGVVAYVMTLSILKLKNKKSR